MANERQAWRDMKKRCMRRSDKNFKDYGGRGITVDPSWLTFETFLADMGPCPPGHTLDRQNNDLGYAPGNCIWATRKQQARNRRSSRHITIGGVTRSVVEWCELNGIRMGTALQRMNEYGWSPETAVTLRVRDRK